MSAFDIKALVEDVALAPYLAEAQRKEAVRRQNHLDDAAAYRGVCVSGMGPGPFRERSFEDVLAEAQDAKTSREAYLISNLGKARSAIAKGCRAAEDASICFHEIGYALSRGDGSAAAKAEELQALALTLKIIAADVQSFVRLVKAEGE